MSTAPIYNFFDAWDDSTVTFAAIKVTVTDSASDAASQLISFVIDSDEKAAIDKAGNLSLDGVLTVGDAAQTRTNLGLGNMAVQNSSNVTITGGSITGINDIAVADGGTGASNAAAARANLGLVIGTDVLAFDANLQTFVDEFSLPTNDGTANQVIVTDGSGNLSFGSPIGVGDLLSSNNLSDVSSASQSRINLGLEIGADVQAYAQRLDNLSALTVAANQIAVFSSTTQFSAVTYSGLAQTLSANTTALAYQQDLDLEVGVDVQAYNDKLQSISTVTFAADQIALFTAADAVSAQTFTALAQSLAAATNAASAQTILSVEPGVDVLAYDANLQDFVDAFSLPTTDGSADQFLQTDGLGNLSFATVTGGGGGISAITFDAGSGITITPSDLTQDGTVTIATTGVLLDSEFGTNGLMIRTGAGTYTNRSLSAGSGITITNADGVAAAPEIAVTAAVVTDSDFGSDGLLTRTASGTYTSRTITAGNGITVTNGDGVSGNPTIAADIQSDPTGVTGADAITNIISLTQAEYDAITTPDTATVYIITS